MAERTTSADAASTPNAAPVATGHPLGFYFIFCGELAERFSYYGMRGILPLYMVTVLHYNRTEEMPPIFSLFKAACYILPLIGGYLADRFFGKYWTIVGFSIPYVAGHFILGIEHRVALLIALALLAGGSGVIKPNISTLLGLTYDQRRPGQLGLRSSAFLLFYSAVNIGALISLFSLPILKRWALNTYPTPAEAYQVAFQFPAWFMVASLLAFALGKRFYAVEEVGKVTQLSDEELALRWKTLKTLLGVFGVMVFFWVGYEINDSIWVLFIEDHVINTLDLGITVFNFEPDGLQFTNALFVLFFAPLFGTVFRRIDPNGKRFRATAKILVGFIITGMASVVMAMAAREASGDSKVSAWWIVVAYFVLTAGEVLLYGTGLELAYSAAPPNMKSFITACFLLTNALGNIINAVYTPIYNTRLTPEQFFFTTAGIVFLAAITFIFVGRRFNRATEHAAQPAA